MKTQVSIADYRLKIETEVMTISIQFHKHAKQKEIQLLTKYFTEMAKKGQLTQPNEKPREHIVPDPTTPPVRSMARMFCEECQQRFNPNSPRQKYCSILCRSKASNKRSKLKYSGEISIDKTLAEIEANRKQPYTVSN